MADTQPALDTKAKVRLSRKDIGKSEKTEVSPPKDAEGDDSEEFQKRQLLLTITDLFIYSIFVAAISAVAILSMPESRFYFQDVFSHFLTNSDFKTGTGVLKSFWDIRILDQIWDYFFGILIPLTYSGVGNKLEETYAANLKKDFLLVNENILVVLPRVRQVRVRNNSCTVPEGFIYIFDSCYYFFDPELEDREGFGLQDGSLWTWQNESITMAETVSGEISSYTGGGFFMDFDRNQSGTEKQFGEMWNNTWIDHGTRAIIIDVVSYTQRDNLFCIVTLLFEIPPSGGVIASADIRVQKLLRYETTEDKIILGLEFVVIVFLVYYAGIEVVSILRNRKEYMKDPWNIFDLFIVLLGCSTAVVGVIRYVLVEQRLEGLPNAMQNDQFYSFHSVRDIQTAYEVLIGCLALAAWLKMFKFLNLVRPGALVLRAFKKVRMELLALTLMLLLLVFGFAMFAHVIFGTHVEQFSSIGNSMFTLIALFSGGLNFYKDCEEARPLLAPAFFILYIFVVILLFLNWFAAAIVHGLKGAGKDFDALDDSRKVFVSHILKGWAKKLLTLCRCARLVKKLEDAERAEKTRNDYDIISDLLERNGFGVLERVIFMTRHGVTNDGSPIGKEKVNEIVADLNGMNKLYVEVEEHARVLDQVDKLRKRLEILDHALSDMVVKTDVMIDKMKFEEEEAKKAK